jgi:hypothetical protein
MSLSADAAELEPTSFNTWESSWDETWNVIEESTATPSTKPTSTPQTSAQPTDVQSTEAAMSGGAKAGIGIGAVAGVLAVLGAYFLYRRRRTAYIQPEHAIPPNVAGKQQYGNHDFWEIQGNAMLAEQIKLHRDSENNPAELAATG